MKTSKAVPSSRRAILKGLTAAGAGVMIAPAHRALGANDQVRVAIIGVGDRGGLHLKTFRGIPGVKVVAVCDADATRMEKAKKDDPGIRMVQDYRKILEMKDVDAVSMATPNHWHAAMTVFACQAGKHVYVEKPVSHSIWEGRKMIEAARRYDRIVQGGTQQRSCPAPQEAARDLQDGKYGKVQWIHCMKLNKRDPIGLVDKPQPIPDGVDYNLWCGPAPDDPPMREKFHYDWHWQWNWGDGEMGNWAVHYTDDLCHMLGWTELPTKVQACGGRFLWKDNGETPNMMFALMDHQGIPLVVEIRDLPFSSERDIPGVYKGVREGNIILCEKGIIKLARGAGKAYETDGKTVIKNYSGNAGGGHFENFIDAIRSGNRDDLRAEIATGHVSSSICHLANASYLIGQKASLEDARQAFGAHEDAAETLESVVGQIEANGGTLDELRLGPALAFDTKTEQFTGANAAAANEQIRPKMRKEFEIPEVV